MIWFNTIQCRIFAKKTCLFHMNTWIYTNLHFLHLRVDVGHRSLPGENGRFPMQTKGFPLCSWRVTGVNYLLRSCAICRCRLSCGEVRGEGWNDPWGKWWLKHGSEKMIPPRKHQKIGSRLCLWTSDITFCPMNLHHTEYVIHGFQFVQHERCDLQAKQMELWEMIFEQSACWFCPGMGQWSRPLALVLVRHKVSHRLSIQLWPAWQLSRYVGTPNKND